MAYGITSSSQLIDIDTIKSGCQQFIDALDDFTTCGDKVIEASEICNKKALSVDDTTMEYSISDVGTAISDLKSEYTSNAENVLQQAQAVYNAQVTELNQYIAAQNAANQSNS